MTASASDKQSTLLIDFFWGPTKSEFHFGVTNNNSELNIDGLRYYSEPNMRLSSIDRSGGLTDSDVSIDVSVAGQDSRVRNFLTGLSNGEPWPKTAIHITELLTSGTQLKDVETLYLFRGSLSSATRNSDGRENVVTVRAKWPKLAVGGSNLSYPVTVSCVYPYAGQGCGITITDYSATPQPFNPQARQRHRVEVTSISGTSVTLDPISGLVNERAAINTSLQPGGPLQDKWTRGFLERDGLRLQIREYRPGTFFFLLERRPPSGWLNQEVWLNPGCMKTPDACALRGNTTRFGGLAWGSPTYNPLLDSLAR